MFFLLQVQVNNGEKFSGVMFVKNKYDSCRVEVANSDAATLVLGLPKDFGMRPINLEDKETEEKDEDKKSNKDKPELVKEGAAESDDDFRHKRQVESRDCGIVDMVISCII